MDSGTNQLTVEVLDPEGYVVIDDIRFGIGIGGIRLIKGVTLREIDLLAKSMSYKLHTFGFPLSGGKGGVNSDSIEDFYRFVANDNIKELISGKDKVQFITGPDIGTSEKQYYEALKRAGLTEYIRKGLLSNKSRDYELPFDNVITAYGVIVASEELLRGQVAKDQDPLAGKSFVIEGFGKVGSGFARLIQGRGKLRAVSTRYGCIIANEPDSDVVEGDELNIDQLLQLREDFGDDFIYHTGLKVHPIDELFGVDCDILVPGARTEVITGDIAKKIIKGKPIFVVPVANYPYTEEGLKILNKAGIGIFPDFIASAGAVIAAMIEMADAGGEEEAFQLVHAAIAAETKDLLAAIKACGDGTKTMYGLAIERVAQKRKELLADLDRNQTMADIAEVVITRYLPNLLANRDS